MKKLLSLLLAALMLLSLGVGAFADEEETPDYTTGTPWLASELEGNVTADTPTNLKDDFYLAVNKDKLLKTEIAEGYSYAGTMKDALLQCDQDVKDMFLGDAPEAHDAKLAYDLFWLMMDWDSRNALGVAPLKEAIDRLEAVSSTEELTTYFMETPLEELFSVLWYCGSTTDLNDSTRHILYFSDPGMLLGDSAEYKELTTHGKVVKDAYIEYATKMLLKLGYSEEETAQKIENCFAFDTLVAESIPTLEEQQSPDYLARINQHWTREQMEQAQGKIPILEYLEKNLGYPEAEEYVMYSSDYLEKLNELYTEENLPLIRDELIVCSVLNTGSMLDRECYEWSVACNNAINGSTGIMDDETAFSIRVSNSLDWAVARLYAERYLKEEDKARIEDMIDMILEAYHGIILEADFLSDETRAKAIEKLDAIDKEVLYPDSWDKYSYEGLDFASREEGGSYWDASIALDRYAIDKMRKEYSEPVDKERWVATPQTVNCCYYALNNTMYIFGAFARGDVYNSDMSDEELYGKLGFVIGHEISHAFDSTGAQFDKDGNMTDWWTDEDYEAFLARNEKLADYLSAMSPWEGENFRGGTMTGEACADMAGVKVMLRIAAEKPDFDYDTFFRSMAEIWLTKDSLQAAYRRLNDVHPMPYLRVNTTLQQFDEFLETYGITEGDGMYLAPEDRVTIW